ncbi:UNKNOWN [Stylonychia lemnae]|uniref:Uncharacterized protein n=1 Tax=Stylonychia lemnae TaxID=5949 RepID=A0A078B6N7_STYLE|nr:UNKNOWN [Stylonychia lemnae]|eukprot:CDW90205.1 UNKNOWN [Stylonychia lemnae]
MIELASKFQLFRVIISLEQMTNRNARNVVKRIFKKFFQRKENQELKVKNESLASNFQLQYQTIGQLQERQLNFEKRLIHQIKQKEFYRETINKLLDLESEIENNQLKKPV